METDSKNTLVAMIKPIRILRLPEVKSRVGLGKTAIYAGMKDGTFPKQVSLGGDAVGWVEDEIDAWILARIAARDQASNDPQARAAA